VPEVLLPFAFVQLPFALVPLVLLVSFPSISTSA